MSASSTRTVEEERAKNAQRLLAIMYVLARGECGPSVDIDALTPIAAHAFAMSDVEFEASWNKLARDILAAKDAAAAAVGTA